jgi:hypothetical protein
MRRYSQCGLFAVIGALLVALPAVPAPGSKKAEDKPEGPVTPEQREATANNLRQIGLAFHNHHDVNGALPSNLKAKDGKPGLSWRVAILPYVEEQELYKQFKLDEPWDSDHNAKLIEKMPKLYVPVRGKADKAQTFYQMFAGKQTMLDPDGRPVRLADITDGLSNTLMVAEAGKAVTWTKPDDIPYDGDKLPRLGGMFGGDFYSVMGDGAVYRFKKEIDPDALRRGIERADGQVVNFEGVRVEAGKE